MNAPTSFTRTVGTCERGSLYLCKTPNNNKTVRLICGASKKEHSRKAGAQDNNNKYNN